MDLHNPAYRLTPSQDLVVRNVHFRQHTIVLFLFWNIVYKKIQFFSCRHFPTPNADTAFTKVGIKNWKKIKKNFCNMQNAEVRSIAREAGSNFNQQAQLVSSLRSHSDSEKVAASRTYARQIINILLYLRKQRLSLQGHNETTSSANRGNFLELCDWYANKIKYFGNCTIHHVTSPSHPSKTN